MRKRLWSPDEDEKLQKYVSQHGFGNWSEVAKQTGLQRCGKSCRLRWINYLRPDLKRGKFSTEEKITIVNLQKIFGNSWSKIAAHLPGRTDSDIKNFWHSHFRKKRPQQVSLANSTIVQESSFTFGAGGPLIPTNPTTTTAFPSFHTSEMPFCSISAATNALHDLELRGGFPALSVPCLEDEIQTGKQDRGYADSELISAVCNNNSWYSGNARHDLMSCLSGNSNINLSSSGINLSSSGTSNDSRQSVYRDAAVPPEGLELVVWSCVNRTSHSDQRAPSADDDQVLRMITPQTRNIFHANFNQ